MADPRAADVALAQRLLDEAAEQGAGRLPALSAAELWVLCGDRQVLADDAEARWWVAMGEPERKRLGAAMLDLLTDRGLLRPAADADGSLPMAPELALIVAARQLPAVVAVATTAGGSAQGAPRMFGLGQGGQPVRVLVAEVVSDQAKGRFGPLHHFSLLSTERAGRALAAWAAERPAGRLGRRGHADHDRIIEIYRYQQGEQLDRDQIVVSGQRSGQLQLTIQRLHAEPGTATPSGPPELAALLTSVLTGRQP